MKNQVGAVYTDLSTNLEDATIYLTPVAGLAMSPYQSAYSLLCCFTWPIACSYNQDCYCWWYVSTLACFSMAKTSRTTHAAREASIGRM